MVIASIPREEIRQTRAVQDWLAEGRQEGKASEAAKMTIRLLNRRCGTLSDANTVQIQALQLEQLEALGAGQPRGTSPRGPHRSGRDTAQPPAAGTTVGNGRHA
jgi:hypothetical protein